MTFFFSSRRRHTSYIGDWSSDVCSSDLRDRKGGPSSGRRKPCQHCRDKIEQVDYKDIRSEERRVGKECRARWLRHHYKEEDRHAHRGKKRIAQPWRTADIGDLAREHVYP